MKEKYLFLGQGSPSDPGFDDVPINGVPYRDFMKERGIHVVSGVVESCHGCFDLMSRYSQEMQYLAERGNRVVAILQGGLLFGLPSIQATQTTFPIISCPTDFVAYTSFMVPSGHAAIATVGVERKVDDVLETQQREKALTLAERILNLDDPEVNVFASFTGDSKLREKLNELGVKDKPYNMGQKGLSLVYHSGRMRRISISEDNFAIRADIDENLHDWNYFNIAESRHHSLDYNQIPFVQVRGLDNLAIFAAKIISLQRPELIDIIKNIGKDKRASYEKRNLVKEAGVVIPMIWPFQAVGEGK